jgi:hypothetical protein
MESKKQVIDYSNNREITLEGETFLDIDVTEDESLIEVEFYEAE